MKKEEVDLIIFKVSSNGQDAINMKIYKNGTTCRSGVGGLPQLGISAMSFVNDTRFFDPLLAKVPDEIFEKPINYEEPTPNGYVEYVVAFYSASEANLFLKYISLIKRWVVSLFGKSQDSHLGERTDWKQSTGIRVKLDAQSRFNHPIMSLLDGLTMEAAELTNDLYFDAIMQIVYKAKSSTLPKETILTCPKTDTEIKADFENYVSQMLQSARKWDMRKYVENKTYEIEGMTFHGQVEQTQNSFRVLFVPGFKIVTDR